MILLQETHRSPTYNPQEWRSGKAIFNSKPKREHASGGTALLTNHPAVVFKTNRRDNYGRILAAEIIFANQVFQIINIYAPITSAESIKENNRVFKNLFLYVNPNLPIILDGDFNILDDFSRDR